MTEDQSPLEATQEQLDASECWRLLRTTVVCRVAAVVDDALAIRPANFAVDRGTLLLRTGHGSWLSRLPGRSVVFEADGTETAGDQLMAWSVIVEGTVRAVSAPDELVETFAVPLFPWHAGPKPVFVRIEPATLSGLSFPIQDTSAWSTSFDATPRPAAE